jgi:uncharacterized protein YprB with RNaseH-like and TPR domain
MEARTASCGEQSAARSGRRYKIRTLPDCQLYDVVVALEARRQQIEDCYAFAIIPYQTYRRWLRAREVVRLIEAASDRLWG